MRELLHILADNQESEVFMNDKTRLVFHGFLELSSEEQSQLMQAILDYYGAEQAKRAATFTENSGFVAKRISLGPLAGACPCCGK